MQPSLLKRSRQQRDQRVATYQHLVGPLAHRYAQCSPEPLEDLRQVGLLGLLRAAERYNPQQQVSFEAFARPHIRGAILHHLRDRAWLVRLPRRQAELQQQLGRGQAPSSERAPEAEAVWLRRWAALVRPLSLEVLAGLGEEAAAGLLSEPHGMATHTDAYVPRDLDPSWEQHNLAQILSLLDQRQQAVLRCVVLQGWSYRRTAAELGVSAATVQRALHEGLATLRRRLQQQALRVANPGDDPAPSAVAGW